MLKKNILLIIIMITSSCFANDVYFETDRTVWIPWTIEHTYLWEQYELSDKSPSEFRRNEFFEDVDTLVKRDANWQTLCTLLQEKNTPLFFLPSLGFAILDKHSHELLGTIRFHISSMQGYISIGYGLKPSARQQKLGSEIAAHIIPLINAYLNKPIATLKNNYTKNMFLAAWYEQGKQTNPDFDLLLDYFETETTSFKGIAAYVDIINQPSLSILIRNGMHPTEIECVTYFLEKEPHIFGFCILLLYPLMQEENSYLKGIVNDLLSRDGKRINRVHEELKTIFNIAPQWTYLLLNREQKAQLKLVQAKIISSEVLSHINGQSKRTELCQPPYCFLK